MSSSVIAGLSLETVLYEKKTGIAYVTLNRPKVLNALNKRAIAELKAAFEDAREDSEVHGSSLPRALDVIRPPGRMSAAGSGRRARFVDVDTAPPGTGSQGSER